MRPTRHNFAFTMIELVLLLAIIAIVCMMVAPSFDGFAKGRIGPNTAAQFAATARWCHVKSIQDGVTYRLNIDPGGTSWYCSKDDGTGQNFRPITNDDMGLRYTLAEGVTIEALNLSTENGELYVAFEPNGETTPGKFRVRYRGENTVDVLCDSPTANYRVLPPQVRS